MEQILPAYRLPKEIVIIIMMVYKNLKVMVCLPVVKLISLTLSLESARKYIRIISIYNLPRLNTTNTNRSNERKWFHTKKNPRCRRYPTEIIMDAVYTIDLVLLRNTSSQAKSLLHNLEYTAWSIGLQMNSNKTEYMYFKWNAAILNGKPLKLVDQFIYRGRQKTMST